MSKSRINGPVGEPRDPAKELFAKITGHERRVAEGRQLKQASRFQQPTGPVRDNARGR
jgi:uncharacterized protein YjbJ (UPF0337 family)